MAVWERHEVGQGRVDQGWSRRDKFVEAKSREEAAKLVAKIMGYEVLSPASGAGGRFFLVLCGGKAYICRAKDKGQARAYVGSQIRCKPARSVFPVTINQDRSPTARENAGLPPIRLVETPPPNNSWQCPHCQEEDEGRHPDDNEDPCVFCGAPPYAGDEAFDDLFTTT